MQDLIIQVIDCKDEFDHDRLDMLVNTVNVQHKTKYLKVLTQTVDNDFKGYFIVAKLFDEIIAWTYAFVDREFTFHGLLTGRTEKIYNKLPLKFKTAFISSPVAEYNVFHISKAFKHEENFIVSKMMAETLAFFKKQKVKLLIIKDHISKYPSKYLHRHFTHMNFMPGTYLDFGCSHHGCTCFEDYLMSLKQKWRSNIRNKINRRKDELEIEVINASSLTEDECVRCHELYFQTRGKQRLKHECLTSDYFCACGTEFGDKCKMIIARAEGKIIGFAQLLENEDDVINVRMGMDYEQNKEYNLYYHLFYENILYCINNHKRRLYTSQTSYRPKLELGAKLIPLHTYVHFYNVIFHKIFSRIFTDSCKCYSELLETDKPSEVLTKYNLSPY